MAADNIIHRAMVSIWPTHTRGRTEKKKEMEQGKCATVMKAEILHKKRLRETQNTTCINKIFKVSDLFPKKGTDACFRGITDTCDVITTFQGQNNLAPSQRHQLSGHVTKTCHRQRMLTNL